MRRALLISLALVVVVGVGVTSCRTHTPNAKTHVIASSAPPSEAQEILPPTDAAAVVPVISSASAAPVEPEVEGPILAPIFPLPKAPPGASAEEVLIASSICNAGYVANGGPHPNIGCRSHPPFAKPEKMPDGKLEKYTGDFQLFCQIEGVFHGAFTRPGAMQAIVSFAQCLDDPGDTWDIALPGSAVLIERIDGHWREVGYEPLINTQFCKQAHRKDGRDFLMCRSGLGTGSTGEVTYFFLLDFARPGRHARSVVILFGDMTPCMLTDPAAFHLDKGLVTIKVSDMTMSDLNDDGIPDLSFDVDRRYAPPSAALDAKAGPLCKAGKDPMLALPAAKRTHIEIVSSGAGGATFFAPTPASKKELDAWEAAAPDNMYGLKGIAPPMLTP